jgi:hypothetical protein
LKLDYYLWLFLYSGQFKHKRTLRIRAGDGGFIGILLSGKGTPGLKGGNEGE